MRRLAVIAVLAGCDPAPGSPEDLDDDQVLDTADPCIAAAVDDTLDDNADGVVNVDDPCPRLTGTGGDADLDGFPDVCDPFPTAGGDRRRCFMRFSDPRLNASLWTARPGEAGWNVRGAGKLTAPVGERASIVPVVPLLESPISTTFHMDARFADDAGAPDRTLGFLVRAGATPGPTDVGCVVRGDTTGSQLAAFGDFGEVAKPMIPLTATIGMTLWVTIVPHVPAATITCRARVGPNEQIVTTDVVLPDGRIGFVASHAGADVLALSIFERDN